MTFITAADMVYASADWSSQLVLMVLWAQLWYWVLPFVAKNILTPWINAQPWKDQWADLSESCFRNGYFVEFPSKQAAFEYSVVFMSLILQHVVGGILAMPSALGVTGPVATAMGCHGGLCEAGWELQDVVVRAHQVLFQGKAGKEMNPTPMLCILAMHHFMGMSMVVPMNVYYNDSSYYHEFVFLLQFAAATAMMAQNYGFTLDVKTATGLRQMKVIVAGVCVVIFYSRLFRYWYVGYQLVLQYWVDSNIGLLCLGGFVLIVMGLFNILMVVDAVGKFKKFAFMKAPDKEVVDAQMDTLRSFQRHNPTIVLSKSRKEWAKVRGALHMGVLKRPRAAGAMKIVPNKNSDKRD